jgi:hypothetical protein
LDPPDNNDTRLISGSWYVENVLGALDEPGEFFFDVKSHMLYFYPNASSPDERGPPPSDSLIASQLQNIVTLQGTSASNPIANVSIRDLGFRDGGKTFMEEWAAPSGGDWALHRGGALFVTGAENIHVDNCTFVRLDGNAIFLSGYSRQIAVTRSEFAYIGENAIATWGDTDEWDATSGQQPRDTLVEGNFFHDLGLYEKQSSAWGQAKTCLSTIRNNIMFNLPRAAINFNDGLGGGTAIERNVIFNTCRESGDHGPINSWDRMPFLTKVASGQPSFTPAPNKITSNLIMANYGGSQGVDNDDGSSLFHIEGNFFYSADGFKMDYGGHDSLFHDNLVVVFPVICSSCHIFSSIFFPVACLILLSFSTFCTTNRTASNCPAFSLAMETNFTTTLAFSMLGTPWEAAVVTPRVPTPRV